MKRRPIGDILLEMGAIDEHQLQSALAHHRQWGMPLGRAIVEKRFCTAEQVLAALSRQTLMQVIDLSRQQLDAKLTSVLPKKVAEQHRAVPLRLEGARGETLVIAIAAPASLESLDEIKAVTGKKRITPYLADDASIERAFGLLYLGYDKAETSRVEPISRAIHLDEVEFDLSADAEPPQIETSAWTSEAAIASPTPPTTAPAAVEPPRERPVLIFGWADEAARAMALTLSAEGIPARIASAQEVAACSPDDVIVAPLPAIEAVVPRGQKARGRLVVASKAPETDLPRAQVLGARGFLVAPVDAGLLIRSVRRCKQLPSSSAAHAA